MTMLQLVGSWSNNVTANVYERVHQHNVRIAARHGYYHTIGITNTTRWASHPAYAKSMATHDQCVNEHAELVWFLDGDVVLMNPYIPVELIWYYYKHQLNNTLNVLFSCDNFDLNSSVFIVNCSSPTAVKTLEYWEIGRMSRAACTNIMPFNGSYRPNGGDNRIHGTNELTSSFED
jgi:hypothetical protein